MQINEHEVTSRKVVGNLKGKSVVQVGLVGGLHLLFVNKGNKFEPLGAGAHPAIARHLAKKKNQDLEFTDLNKSEHVNITAYEFCLPYYEALTDAIIARWK